jgi:hypothetical protein
MRDPAGTLQPGEDHANETIGPTRGPDRSARPIRFTHASGSRPLEGFTIKRGIGIGGFGEVYYATTDAGKDVALKQIQRNLDVELRGVRQCLNLKHPNLLALYDIKYDADGGAWVVMEYVAGESLQDVIERNPNGMPEEQALLWLHGVAAGVAYLHDHGIVHRDLKPGNVFLDQAVVKVGDYGLSKFISCSRRSGQTESVGTFHYMAPEIGRGRYGKEIDIYSLGIVLYEMLTGRVPYEGESAQEIIMKHLTAEPDQQGVEAPYRNMIATALKKDPHQRPGSVAQFLQPLGGGTAGERLIPGAPPVRADETTSRAPASPEASPAAHGASHLAGEGGPQTPPILVAEVVDSLPKEPIARAVVQLWQHLERRFNGMPLGTVRKYVLLTVAIVVLLASARWTVPLAVIAGLAYAVYLLIRALVLGLRPAPPKPKGPLPPSSSPVSVRPDPVPDVSRAGKCLVGRRDGPDMSRQWLREKPVQQRVVEWTGSLLMAMLVAPVLSLIMVVIGNKGLETSFYGWAPVYMWMTLTGMIGAAAILTLTKFLEGSDGDQALRRFAMLVMGLAVGAASWGVSSTLLVKPTYILRADSPATLSALLFEPDGTPRLLGYMGYFAGLFLILRWWRLADPLRSTRLSIWATVLCVAGALVLHSFYPFPRSFMLAATVAVTVQLSAPWIGPEQRKQLTRGEHRD